MSKTWVVADHHFGHKNIVRFLRPDGTKLRPWETIEEHDNEIIRRHNSVVSSDDRVYCLGDFGHPSTAHQLNGRLVLVKGNHDEDKLSKYDGFEDVRGYVVKKGLIMSHIPIHPGSMGRWQFNVHGHTHAGSVEGDDRYICVSLEQTDYYPLDLQTVLNKIDYSVKRRDEYNAEVN